MSFRSPPALMTLVIAVLALVSAPRPAYACQLSRPVSPLEHLYGASAVVYGEVVTATAQGYLVRFKDTLAGATNLTETVLPFSDCDTLTVGTRLALALRSPMPSRFVLYPVMQWPSEAENQELIRAFSGAATDAARAKVLVAHAHKGRASYVDFPAIALFLLHTPGVVKALSAPAARRLLADLSHHPRARADATAALAAHSSSARRP